MNRVIKILEKGGADKNGMSNFIFSPHLPTQFISLRAAEPTLPYYAKVGTCRSG